MTIACSLDAPGLDRRLDEFRDVFRRAFLAGERISGGVRWRFRRAPGLETELLALAEREHRCCRFFRFDVHTEGDEIRWDTTVEAGAESVLDELFSLPERLGGGTL